MTEDDQRQQWERALAEHDERYGANESAAGRVAARRLRERRLNRLLELGAGQGRDTLFFAREGFDVHALDYASSAVRAIAQKARHAGLAAKVTVSQHDVREPLPYGNETFDACYSHMLFCMALTEAQLRFLATEILRVLRPGGLCIYTARNTADADFGKGVHHGENLYESGGFVVHYFSDETVTRLADGYEVLEVERFQEGALPRELFRVTLRKPALR